MKAQDIMTPNVEACSPSTDLATVAMVMWRNVCGIVPVIDEDRRVVGVVTDRDICIAVATRHERPDDVRVEDIMSRHVQGVRPEDDLRRALQTMRVHRVHRLPVVDAGGTLLGVLSITDLVLAAWESREHPAPGLTVVEVFDTMRSICEYRRDLLARADEDAIADELRPA
jgi:CBS domain-containing protein